MSNAKTLLTIVVLIVIFGTAIIYNKDGINKIVYGPDANTHAIGTTMVGEEKEDK